FLNGVCRHELCRAGDRLVVNFLNGVCRHERWYIEMPKDANFLNGVCRHELNLGLQRLI
ncbi:hypothetical protein F967_01015, partial [Acinetobacter sp. CIP 102637]